MVEFRLGHMEEDALQGEVLMAEAAGDFHGAKLLTLRRKEIQQQRQQGEVGLTLLSELARNIR